MINDRYNTLEQLYKPTNRQKAQTIRKGTFWCYGCDRNIVGRYGKCKVCGWKEYPKKQKGIEYPI